MNVEEAVRDLLPILYAAPVEPSKWQEFLDLLTGLTEIPIGYLISSTPEAVNLCLAGEGANYDPETAALYNDRYGADDPFRAGFLAQPRVGLIDGEDLVRRPDLVKTEIWSELLSPRGLHHVTMLCGSCDASRISVLSLWRDSKQGPLDAVSAQLLTALSPHVRTALRLNARLKAVDSCHALSETALDALDMTVVLVDEAGRVQHMNVNAAKRLPNLIGISIQSGRLVASNARDDSQLQELIKRATGRSSRAAAMPSGGAMKIGRPQTTESLQISVVPASERTHIGDRGRYAAIFIGEPRAAPRLRGDVLREVYGLTAAEARVANFLLEGKDLRGAAAQLSIEWTTARFHLKRVFAKTGTRRQTELMRLMLTLPATTE